jgi:hypothetical protein
MVKCIIKNMSDIIKDLFTKHLLNEEEDVFRDRSFPEENEATDFEAGLDTDGVASDFETDDLGFDPAAVVEDNFAEVYAKVDKIEDMIQDLVDPKKDGNLTSLLSKHDRSDSIGDGLIQKLQRPIQKASLALAEVKIVLDQIASSEESLQKRVDSLKSK